MDHSRRILIVEDEQTLRASMARGLSKLSGVTIVEAATVREAHDRIHRLPPDLVISDLDLPDGSGIEVALELDRVGLRLPVVFVSAYVQRYRHKLPTRGDIEVYEKPLALEKLRSVAESKLGLVADGAGPSPFSVCDYIQLASMGRHSVVIDVRCAGGRGRIVIRAGEAWSAEDGLGSGIDAFRRLAFLGAATVTCRTLGKSEVPARNIHGSAESVLLDVARQADEAEHHRPAASVAPPAENGRAVDDGWGDVFRDEKRKSTRPPPRTRSSLRPAVLPRVAFDELFERGVDALLAKDYARALAAFREANELSPDDRRVVANLTRLKEMGFV